jgi:hypothetical protein
VLRGSRGSTYAELDWDGEEIKTTNGLLDLSSSLNTWQVNESWFNNAFLSGGSVKEC